MKIHRRLFLSQAAAMTALGTASGLWGRAASAVEPDADAPILVAIELSGGNDGLNTVIPYRDDAYHRARPTLKIAPEKVLKLNDDLGFHPQMKGLHKLWENGQAQVLMNVGYPNPNRSHFRSMEIWQSGHLDPAPLTGWLGRASDSPQYQAQAPPCFVGSDTTPLTLKGRNAAPFSLSNFESLQLKPEARIGSADGFDPDSGEMRRVAQAFATAESLCGKIGKIPSEPNSDDQNELEPKLSTIRRLIESGIGSRVYYASLGGFDTHSSQEFAHGDLLRKLSTALERFITDLSASKLDDRVLVVVFSEFGRRIAENGSKGTDHGAAGPVLFVGAPVAGGILGGHPNLANPAEGDVPYAIDFRDVYSAILSDWLRIDSSSIVDRKPDPSLKLIRTPFVNRPSRM